MLGLVALFMHQADHRKKMVSLLGLLPQYVYGFSRILLVEQSAHKLQRPSSKCLNKLSQLFIRLLNSIQLTHQSLTVNIKLVNPIENLIKYHMPEQLRDKSGCDRQQFQLYFL
jgi:hypothetical protein